MLVLNKLICRFNAVTIETPNYFFYISGQVDYNIYEKIYFLYNNFFE